VYLFNRPSDERASKVVRTGDWADMVGKRH